MIFLELYIEALPQGLAVRLDRKDNMLLSAIDNPRIWMYNIYIKLYILDEREVFHHDNGRAYFETA